MPKYTVNVSATTNTGASTEDTFIELTAGSGAELRIQRFSIYVESAASDDSFPWRAVRKTVAGATGTSFTPVKKTPDMRASAATALVKNGTTAFSAGTITDIVDQGSINGRGWFEWIPRREDEEILIGSTGIFGLMVKCSAASKVLRATVEYED